MQLSTKKCQINATKVVFVGAYIQSAKELQGGTAMQKIRNSWDWHSVSFLRRAVVRLSKDLLAEQEGKKRNAKRSLLEEAERELQKKWRARMRTRGKAKGNRRMSFQERINKMIARQKEMDARMRKGMEAPSVPTQKDESLEFVPMKPVTPPKEYEEGKEAMPSADLIRAPPMVLVVASENMIWARRHLIPALEDMIRTSPIRMSVFAVESEGVLGAFTDLALVASCNHSIITQGQFGLLAALMAGGRTIVDRVVTGHPGAKHLAEEVPNWLLI